MVAYNSAQAAMLITADYFGDTPTPISGYAPTPRFGVRIWCCKCIGFLIFWFFT